MISTAAPRRPGTLDSSSPRTHPKLSCARATFARTVVAKVNGMGDLLVFLPTLCAIRQLLPNSELIALVPRGLEPLVKSVTSLDGIVGLDSGALRSARRHPVAMMGLVRLMARLSPTCVLNSHDERSALVAAQRLAGVRRRVGYAASSRLASWYTDELHSDLSRSMLENDFQLAEWVAARLGIEAPPVSLPSPRFDLDEGSALLSSHFRESDGPRVVIHPFAQYSYKEWPLEHYQALIAGVLQRHPDSCVTVVTGGRPFPAPANRRVTILNRTSIVELAYVLAAADVVVTNNSGPMNLAWFVGASVIALSGPSPRYWSPPPRHNTSELRANVACAPCESPSYVPRRCLNAARPLACLRELGPELVLAAVDHHLMASDATARCSRLELLGFGNSARRLPG